MFSQQGEVVGVIPPPGITPNLTNPPPRAHTIIAVYIAFTMISTLFTVLRSYTTFFITHQVTVDYYLLFFAWLLAFAYSMIGLMMMRYGLGRHLWDVPFSVFNPNFMKLGAITVTLYSISIMLTKLSILAFFIRFTPWGNLRRTIHIIMVIVVLYSLVVSLEWVYACRPLEKYWDLTITGGSCIDWLKVTVFAGVMNVATDVSILVLPILILRGVQLPKRQKIGVILLLMTGGFVVAVSIVRLKLSADLSNARDISWECVPPALWWAIEAHVAIVCACLSAGKPFLRKHIPWIIESSYGTAPAATKLRTIHSTHTQRLPSRDTAEDLQHIILEGDINSELQRQSDYS